MLAVVAHGTTADDFDRRDVEDRGWVTVAMGLEPRDVMNELLAKVGKAFERDVGIWQQVV